MDCSLLSGILAEQLVDRSHPGIERVFFTNSGAEAVESAIKFARAATKRTRILYCDHAFHGLTTGALALNGGRSSGPASARSFRAPNDSLRDAAALARELRRVDVAAFIAEPIQGKGVNLALRRVLAGSAVALPAAQGPLDPRRGAGRPRGSGTFFCHEQSASPPTSSRSPRRCAASFRSGPCSAWPRSPTPSTAPWIAPWSTPTFSTEPVGDGGGAGHAGRLRRPGTPRPGGATGRRSPASSPLVEQHEFLLDVRG